MFTAPVIADQRLFLRHNSVLQCYDLRREPRPAAPVTKSSPAEDKTRQPDAVFVATPLDVVDRMLEMARVTPKDVVYDLGSGDGRIVLAAARKHKARGVGLPHLNAKLLPQLERLPKGARIAHGSAIPGVPPQEVLRFRSSDDSMEHTLYLWVAPLRRP